MNFEAMAVIAAFVSLLFLLGYIASENRSRAEFLQMEGDLLRNIIFSGIMTAQEGEAKRMLINGLLDNLKMYQHEHAFQIVLMLLARGKMKFLDLRTSGIGEQQEDGFRSALVNMSEVKSWEKTFAFPKSANAEFNMENVRVLLCFMHRGITLQDLVRLP